MSVQPSIAGDASVGEFTRLTCDFAAQPWSEDDLLPVDTSYAEQEIEERQGEGVGARDDLDPFGSRADQFPELSALSQMQLVSAYQQARRIRAALELGVVPREEEEWAAEIALRSERFTPWLLGATFRLVRVVVWERARGRFGEQKAREVLPELLSDAAASVLEAAGEYDMRDGLSFSSCASGKLKQQLHQYLNKHGRSGAMPQTWDRLARLARHTVRELEGELDREATVAEVAERLTVRCRDWAREKLTPEQLSLSPAEQESIIDAKLQKSGMAKALRDDVGEILVVMRQESSLDSLVGESGQSLSELIPDQEDVESRILSQEALSEYAQTLAAGMGGLSDREQESILACWGLVDGTRWTFKKAGQVYNLPDLQIKRMARRAEVRLKAPHAQWAHLVSEDALIFEEAEVKAEKKPSRVSARAQREADALAALGL